MTNYRRGYRVERKAVGALESMGYSVVRAGGSRGPADIVALNQYGVLLIQVKGGTLTPAQMREAKDKLLSMKGPKNCKRQVWCWHNGWDVTDAS